MLASRRRHSHRLPHLCLNLTTAWRRSVQIRIAYLVRAISHQIAIRVKRRSTASRYGEELPLLFLSRQQVSNGRLTLLHMQLTDLQMLNFGLKISMLSIHVRCSGWCSIRSEYALWSIWLPMMRKILIAHNRNRCVCKFGPYDIATPMRDEDFFRCVKPCKVVFTVPTGYSLWMALWLYIKTVQQLSPVIDVQTLYDNTRARRRRRRRRRRVTMHKLEAQTKVGTRQSRTAASRAIARKGSRMHAARSRSARPRESWVHRQN